LGTKGMVSAVIVGSLATAGFILIGLLVAPIIGFLGLGFAPLLGGIIAGGLTKNGYKSVLVGLLSGILGAFIFIIAMIVLLQASPPEWGRSEVEFAIFGLSVGLVFFGLIFGTIGGVIGGGIRNTVKVKKHPEN
jgi:hypothetical protein